MFYFYVDLVNVQFIILSRFTNPLYHLNQILVTEYTVNKTKVQPTCVVTLKFERIQNSDLVNSSFQFLGLGDDPFAELRTDLDQQQALFHVT